MEEIQRTDEQIARRIKVAKRILETTGIVMVLVALFSAYLLLFHGLATGIILGISLVLAMIAFLPLYAARR